MIKALLDAKADANMANAEGETALMVVARAGDVAAAELLVKAGADVNAVEAWGQPVAADVGRGAEASPR